MLCAGETDRARRNPECTFSLLSMHALSGRRAGAISGSCSGKDRKMDAKAADCSVDSWSPPDVTDASQIINHAVYDDVIHERVVLVDGQNRIAYPSFDQNGSFR